MSRKVSQITLHQNTLGNFLVRIDHDGRVASSSWRSNAADAYDEAEMKLVIKPGYVCVVPKDER